MLLHFAKTTVVKFVDIENRNVEHEILELEPSPLRNRVKVLSGCGKLTPKDRTRNSYA